MLGSVALLVVVLFAVAIDADLDSLARQLNEFIGQRLVGEAVHGNLHGKPGVLQAVEVKVLQVFGRGKMIFRDDFSGLGIFNCRPAEMKTITEVEQCGQREQHQDRWKPTAKTTQQMIHQSFLSPIPDEEKCSHPRGYKGSTWPSPCTILSRAERRSWATISPMRVIRTPAIVAGIFFAPGAVKSSS